MGAAPAPVVLILREEPFNLVVIAGEEADKIKFFFAQHDTELAFNAYLIEGAAQLFEKEARGGLSGFGKIAVR